MLGTNCLQRTLKSVKALPFKDPCIMIHVIVALSNTHPHSFVHGKKVFIIWKTSLYFWICYLIGNLLFLINYELNYTVTFLFKSHECTFVVMSYLMHLFSKVIRCLVTQLCLTLCDPMDCSPPGFSIHGISQANKLEWIAISFPRGSSPPRNQTIFSCIAGRFFTREAACNSPVWCKKLLHTWWFKMKPLY